MNNIEALRELRDQSWTNGPLSCAHWISGETKRLRQPGSYRGKQIPSSACASIRLCLSRRDLFRTHLRAILRAGDGGNFQPHVPIDFRSEELREALVRTGIRLTAHSRAEDKAHVWPIPVGIVIEVPSAAPLDRPVGQDGGFLQHRHQRSHAVRACRRSRQSRANSLPRRPSSGCPSLDLPAHNRCPQAGQTCRRLWRGSL